MHNKEKREKPKPRYLGSDLELAISGFGFNKTTLQGRQYNPPWRADIQVGVIKQYNTDFFAVVFQHQII